MHKHAITIAIPADFNSLTPLIYIYISPFFNSKIYLQIFILHKTSCNVENISIL